MQSEMQMEAQKQQFTAQLESAKLEREQQMERFKAELDANTKIRVAQISHSASMLPEDQNAHQQMSAALNQDLRNMIEILSNQISASNNIIPRLLRELAVVSPKTRSLDLATTCESTLLATASESSPHKPVSSGPSSATAGLSPVLSA